MAEKGELPASSVLVHCTTAQWDGLRQSFALLGRAHWPAGSVMKFS